MLTANAERRTISLTLETVIIMLTAVVLMLTIVLTSRELEHRLESRIETIRLEVKSDIQRLEDRLLPVLNTRNQE